MPVSVILSIASKIWCHRIWMSELINSRQRGDWKALQKLLVKVVFIFAAHRPEFSSSWLPNLEHSHNRIIFANRVCIGSNDLSKRNCNCTRVFVVISAIMSSTTTTHISNFKTILKEKGVTIQIIKNLLEGILWTSEQFNVLISFLSVPFCTMQP